MQAAYAIVGNGRQVGGNSPAPVRGKGYGSVRQDSFANALGKAMGESQQGRETSAQKAENSEVPTSRQSQSNRTGSAASARPGAVPAADTTSAAETTPAADTTPAAETVEATLTSQTTVDHGQILQLLELLAQITGGAAIQGNSEAPGGLPAEAGDATTSLQSGNLAEFLALTKADGTSAMTGDVPTVCRELESLLKDLLVRLTGKEGLPPGQLVAAAVHLPQLKELLLGQLNGQNSILTGDFLERLAEKLVQLSTGPQNTGNPEPGLASEAETGMLLRTDMAVATTTTGRQGSGHLGQNPGGGAAERSETGSLQPEKARTSENLKLNHTVTEESKGSPKVQIHPDAMENVGPIETNLPEQEKGSPLLMKAASETRNALAETGPKELTASQPPQDVQGTQPSLANPVNGSDRAATAARMTPFIIGQVVQKAKLVIAPGVSEMQIQLKPDFLGKLNLNISTENGLVTAKFNAESYQVKAIIEANLSTLKDALAQQGFKVDQLIVDISHDRAFSEFSHREGFQTNQRNTGRLNSDGTEEEYDSKTASVQQRGEDGYYGSTISFMA